MNELYFKISIITKTDIPFTLEESRRNPTFSTYQAEFSERIITIIYKPAKGFNLNSFVDDCKNALTNQYQAYKVEQLETIKQIDE